MCRLFGLASDGHPISARFWLLDASDSLQLQSRREPDGYGIGWFDEHGRPQTHRDCDAAWQDPAFASSATSVQSSRFIAHVRFASTGPTALKNTHPFELDGRLFAHNGVVEQLDVLRAELGPALANVHGDTDSELTFALLTREIAAAQGDVVDGIRRAAQWMSAHLSIFAWNIVLATSDELYALRWPDTHELWWLERERGGNHGGRPLRAAGSTAPLAVHSSDLAVHGAVVVASEPMDEHPGWTQLQSGELLRVAHDGAASCELLLPHPPTTRLTLADLDEDAVASQQSTQSRVVS